MRHAPNKPSPPREIVQLPAFDYLLYSLEYSKYLWTLEDTWRWEETRVVCLVTTVHVREGG